MAVWGGDVCNPLGLPRDLAELLTASNVQFVCPNCLAGRHQCFVCKVEGTAGRDVFRWAWRARCLGRRSGHGASCGEGAVLVARHVEGSEGAAGSAPPQRAATSTCRQRLPQPGWLHGPLLPTGTSPVCVHRRCISAACGHFYHPQCAGVEAGQPIFW